MPLSLFRKLKKRYKVLKNSNQNIFLYNYRKNSKISLLFSYLKKLSEFKEKLAVHYPLNFLWPLHLARNDVLSCSVVDPGFPKNRKIIYRIFDFIGLIFFANKIDVLNPAIFLKLSKYLKLRKKMFLTPNGSFYDKKAPLSTSTKKITLLVYGRFVKMKGILEILKNYIALAKNLEKKTKLNFELVVAGYGPLKKMVQQQVKIIKDHGFKAKLIIRPDVKKIFRYSYIFLSNQKDSNYPSRICIESLARGCPILISCSGDSQAFGRNKPGIYYFKNINDIKKIAKKILFIKNKTFLPYRKKIQNYANKRFSSSKAVVYYKNILS